MQKTLIALAVAGLMSGAAFAQTSFTIGGKFDAGYQFKHTANADNSDGTYNGTKTTETLGDGGSTSSRLTFGAKEKIAPGYDIRVDFDLRFNNVMEGKSAGTGGLSTNDKKAMAFTTPFGTLQWGVANLMSGDFKLAEKPYMVKPYDSEVVKYGVSQSRESALTSRNTSYWSPTFTIGPVKTLFKGSFAVGDNQSAGTNDTDPASSGNVVVFGNEGVVMDGLVDWGIDVTDVRPTSSMSGAAGYGRNYNHYYLNIRPIPGNKNLKLSTGYYVYKGASSGDGGYYKEKNTNIVLTYNFNNKAQLGLGVSHLHDLGSNRNSGRGIMFGGNYMLTKSVQLYAGIQSSDFERNEKISGGKYDGTKTGFSDSLSKLDLTYYRIGIAKDF